MYFDKFINYVKAVNDRNDLKREEKDLMMEDMKAQFVEIANISDKIIDVKFGIRKYDDKKDYKNVINSAIASVHKINTMYKEQFGEVLFESEPRTTADIYELSRALDKEMLENLENE